jgi:hypothetical protein
VNQEATVQDAKKALSETLVPSYLSARLLGATLEDIDRLRRLGNGIAIFEPTEARKVTSEHFYSVEDLARVGIIWRMRPYVKLRHRESLWNQVTRKKVIEAFERPDDKPLFMLVALLDDPNQPVRVRFQDQSVDPKEPVEEPEVQFNLSAIVKGLWNLVEKANILGLVEGFEPGTAVRVTKKK